jgi:hypothetical protein
MKLPHYVLFLGLLVAETSEMRNRRLVALLFAAAIATAAGLAVPSPAQAEDDIVKLMSVQNGKCLQPASLNHGDVIVQQACDGSHAQQWTVHLVSSTKVHLVNRASHFCLEVRDGAVNGARIDQWTCNRISNENWSFGITNNLLVSLVSKTSSHCIATPGAQDGLPVELRGCNGNPAQRWSRPPG